MVTLAIIFIIGSFLASALVIAAAMLSSRLGESEMIIDGYQATRMQRPDGEFSSWAQPAEINA